MQLLLKRRVHLTSTAAILGFIQLRLQRKVGQRGEAGATRRVRRAFIHTTVFHALTKNGLNTNKPRFGYSQFLSLLSEYYVFPDS